MKWNARVVPRDLAPSLVYKTTHAFIKPLVLPMCTITGMEVNFSSNSTYINQQNEFTTMLLNLTHTDLAHSDQRELP